MKKFILFTFGLFFSLTAFAQKAITPDSKITEVTVYLSGAQITREAKVTLSPGKNEIVLEHLEEGINPSAIQVAAPPEVLLSRVTHEVNYLKVADKPRRIQQLEDSLELYQNKLGLENNEKSVLEQEKAMILQNQSLKGNDTGVSVAELQKAADFFRTRLTDIHDRLYKNAERQKEMTKQYARIQNQLNELNYRENQPSNDIVVSCESKVATTVTLRLRYVVASAGWTPGYDLRAKDTQSPLQLDYRADVYQGTGIDWKDVLLTLSTANPTQGGTKPELSPWSLYIQDYAVINSRGGRNGTATGYLEDRMESAKPASATSMDEEADYTKEAQFGEGNTLANYTTVNAGATTVEFRISVVQDIASDGKAHQVNVQSHQLTAAYQHFAIPKLDPDAFLVALATDWEDLDLLPGYANIFFEGTYVSQAWIDPAVTDDTLSISLGRDKKVVITREQLKDYCHKKTLGFTKERQFGYEITIRNTKKESVLLNLEDQIPVSQDKTIEVKLEESTGAKLDPDTGKLTWEMNLSAGETRKIKLIYTVKYPKNKYVPGM